MDQEIFSNQAPAPGKIADVDASIAFLEGINLRDEESAKREVGRAFYQLGKLHYDRSALGEAQKQFEKSLSCAVYPRDIFSVFKILGFMIRIASEMLEDDKAQSYISQAEMLLEQLSKGLGSLNAEYFYNAGVICTYKSDFEQAKTNYEMAYNKSKEENEPELLAKTILALANNSFNRADYAQADDYVLQLEQLLKIVQKSYLSGALALFEARLRLEEGRLDDSLKKFKFANESLQKKNCWNLYGYILLGKGRVYKKMGDFDRALTYFTLASESIDRLSFRRLSSLIDSEISDVNDSSVDLYLDRENRKVKERSLGTIDFKHRFVLLEILFLLAKNAGSYFDKEELAKSIWKDEYNPLIHDKLIYTSVSRLRKLIEPKNEKGQKRKYIVRGKDGYTFNSMAKIRFHMESNSSVDKSIGNVELSSPV